MKGSFFFLSIMVATMLFSFFLPAEAVRLELRKDEPGYNSDSWVSINIFADSDRTWNTYGFTYCYLALANVAYYPVDRVNVYRIHIPNGGKCDGGRYGDDFTVKFKVTIENICRVRGSYNNLEIPDDTLTIDIPSTLKEHRLTDGFLIVQNKHDKPVIVRLEISVENPEDGSQATAVETLSSLYPPSPEIMGKKFTDRNEWNIWFKRYREDTSPVVRYSECRRQIEWKLDTNNDGMVGLNDFPSIAAAPALKQLKQFKLITLGSLKK